MKKKIACLHAHYSNIDYIQNSIASDFIELVHFVDPGLMNRISFDQNFDLQAARNKVVEQIEWISQANVDAILITCTNYIALLEEERLTTTIPIIKIDEPFFNRICSTPQPQVLLFTNPSTVQGTMARLKEYALAQNISISNIEARVIENTFELIMQGDKAGYLTEVSRSIKSIILSEKDKKISVAQLSMVESAEKVERELDVQIGNPLKTLISDIELFGFK